MSSHRSPRKPAAQNDSEQVTKRENKRNHKQRHEDDNEQQHSDEKETDREVDEQQVDDDSKPADRSSRSSSRKHINARHKHDKAEDEEDDDGDNNRTEHDEDNKNDDDTFYDAKQDEGQTQMDLKVDSDDPVSKPSLDASHARAHHERTTGDNDEENVNPKRVRHQLPSGDLVELKEVTVRPNSKAVLYWMQREQRLEDNWALLYAAEVAEDHELPLMVVFCMVPKFLDATERQYGWMIRGQQELEGRFREKGIHFEVLLGYSYELLPEYVEKHKIGVVINDFNPLRCHREWVTEVAKQLSRKDVNVYRVDAHNSVPLWVASDKLEYGARTIRTKIHRHLPTYLHEYPRFQPPSNQRKLPLPPAIDWKSVDGSLDIDRTVKQIDWLQPGEAAGREQLRQFCEERLRYFNTKRNDPTNSVLSNMSCYLHFGQISAVRCVLEAEKHRKKYGDAVASFVEEIVVRRELSDNFVWHEPNYDNFQCAKDWARQSLNAHKRDEREFLYSLGEWDCAVTHDELWNAAQIQLTQEGKMHGFMRMYWCKKILEWSSSPEEAHRFAIFLNDRYEVDGREPNGYVGIVWSLYGIHDQGWREREVFGKVRYMNYAGCKRKFNVDKFIDFFPDARVGSEGFKRNQQRAKELDEQRAKESGKSKADPSKQTGHIKRGKVGVKRAEDGEERKEVGGQTKRENADAEDEKTAEDEDGRQDDERDDVGGGKEVGGKRATDREKRARGRAAEQKEQADEHGRTPAAGAKRARKEKPH